MGIHRFHVQKASKAGLIEGWFHIHVPDLWNNSRTTLRWRHNGHDGVSNHQPHDCLLNRLFRRRSKKISNLREMEITTLADALALWVARSSATVLRPCHISGSLSSTWRILNTCAMFFSRREWKCKCIFMIIWKNETREKPIQEQQQ